MYVTSIITQKKSRYEKFISNRQRKRPRLRGLKLGMLAVFLILKLKEPIAKTLRAFVVHMALLAESVDSAIWERYLVQEILLY